MLLRYKFIKYNCQRAALLTLARTGFCTKLIDKNYEYPLSIEAYTDQLKFVQGKGCEKIPIYRLLKGNGQLVNENQNIEASQDTLIQIHKVMITLKILDEAVSDIHNQHRLGFYLTSSGEEAAQIASAAALDNDDMVFAQYREPGVALWRNYEIEDMMNQCFANKNDFNKGRQMPILYGNKSLNYFSISPCLGTQLPQAVGFAYANKLSKNGQCVITYFGDGATSTGDTHTAMNFAATLGCPVIFFCRNNGYAISTSVSEQYASDDITVRGRAYGMNAIKVDGNDALAVYAVTKAARKICVDRNQPVLIEAVTYRVGKHTCNEKEESYRSLEETKYWNAFHNPINMLQTFLVYKGWWKEEGLKFENEIRDKILMCIKNAETKQKGNPLLMFEDVYDVIPPRLKNQMKQYRKFLVENTEKYPQNFESVID